jgi:hypothetical protein
MHLPPISTGHTSKDLRLTHLVLHKQLYETHGKNWQITKIAWHDATAL